MFKSLIKIVFIVGFMCQGLVANEIGKPFVESGHSSSINAVAISSNGKYGLSGGDDRTLRYFDLKSLKIIKVLNGHKDSVCSLDISPNGKYALSGSFDKTIRYWNLETGKTVRILKGHRDAIYSVKISPNGKYALSAGSYDNLIIYWNLRTGKTIRVLKGHTDSVNSVAISSDGKYALSGSLDKTIRYWNLKTGKTIRVLKGHTNSVNSVVISSDGKYALSGSKDKTIKYWDLNIGESIKTLRGQHGIYSVDISSDGKYALSGSYKVVYYSNLKFNNTKVLGGNTNSIKFVSIEGKDKFIIGKSDKLLNYWNPKTAKIIKTLKRYNDSTSSLARSIDGKYALIGNSDGTIKYMDLKTKKILKILKGHSSKANTIVFSIDGKYALSGSSDCTIRYWDLNTGKTIKILNGHNHWIKSVAISSDGKYALSGSWDNTLRYWDLNTGKIIKILKGHFGIVNSVFITANGKYALSGSSDGTIKYWDIKTGKELVSLVSFTDGEWIAITPQGYFNASKNGAKHLNVLTGPMEVSSIDAFYKKFYRPDLVKLALQGVEIKSDESFVDIIKNKPAPKLSFIDTKESYVKTDKSEYVLKIGAKDTGGGIGRVRVYINGSLVNTSDRGFPLKRKEYDKSYKFNIALDEGENRIKVLAWNRDESMQTNPLELTIVSDAKLKAPNLYALIVGIDKFENDELNLNYAVADAKLLNGAIKTNSKALFKNIYIKSLTSKDETSKDNIQKVFKEFSKKMKPNDYFIFYISSHGEVEKDKFYLITSNVLFLDEIKDTAISDNNLIELIGNIPTKNKIVFFDTCYAGDMGAKMASALTKKSIVSGRGLSAKDAIDLLNMESGASIFSASSNTQQALEGYKGQGLYTYFLVDGLKGKADNDKDGFVDLSELNRYIKRSVYKTSKEKFQRAQIPYSNLGIDVPISKIK